MTYQRIDHFPHVGECGTCGEADVLTLDGICPECAPFDEDGEPKPNRCRGGVGQHDGDCEYNPRWSR